MILRTTSGKPEEFRAYPRAESVVFHRTKDTFGGLSNMSPGFSLKVNETRILTSEALYQACRFPHLADVQRKILAQTSPMTAKMVGKPFREQTREDWDDVRAKIMRWCLRVKLAQHHDKFGKLLLSTDGYHIVEYSTKDSYWGAKPADGNTLVGENILGRLLMELRERLKLDKDHELMAVPPLSISEFFLLGNPIETVQREQSIISIANQYELC